jgi:pimeloyl-ACP methyl ester carboxylesterase
VRWLRRVIYLLIVLAAAGVGYEQWAEGRDAERYAPPGRLYDVGDHRLHLVCEGEGQPTVLLEASGMGTSQSYKEVLPLLAKRVRACAYDRAGMGFSERGPGARSAEALAADLKNLVAAAKLDRPLVLAGASMGGLTVELFAREHPADVRALVFIDAVDSQSLESIGSDLASKRYKVCAVATAARLGLVRLADPFKLTGMSAALAYRGAPFATACSMLSNLTQSDRELARAPALPPDLPLLVLTHGISRDLIEPGESEQYRQLEPEWQRLQRALAGRSTRGKQKVVADSGHLIASERPQAVAEAMLELIDTL